MSEIDFTSLEIIPRLPNWLLLAGSHSLPEGIIGSKIVRMGIVVSGLEYADSGLIIDYLPAGSDCVKRVILSLNESAVFHETDG